MIHYILNARGEPVKAKGLMPWAQWMEQADRKVARTEVNGNREVSTVFLGLDHNFMGSGPPVLWESMLFAKGSSANLDCERCAGTREQAEAMHQRMVQKHSPQPQQSNENTE